MPNYLVSASDDAVILRNYEGMLVRYQAEDKPQTGRPTTTHGVSALLQGSKSVLIPENSERMARRRLHLMPELHADEAGVAHEHNGHSHDGCNGDGRPNGHAQELIALGVRVNGCAS
jgi:lysine 2,3-aminomutase